MSLEVSPLLSRLVKLVRICILINNVYNKASAVFTVLAKVANIAQKIYNVYQTVEPVVKMVHSAVKAISGEPVVNETETSDISTDLNTDSDVITKAQEKL